MIQRRRYRAILNSHRDIPLPWGSSDSAQSDFSRPPSAGKTNSNVVIAAAASQDGRTALLKTP
jgi:hypothetical protein